MLVLLRVADTILSRGRTVIITKHIIPSIPIIGPLTANEYTIGDTPSGADEAKKATPEMKWHINLKNTDSITPIYRWYFLC